MLKALRPAAVAALAAAVLLAAPGPGSGGPGVLGATDAGYALCGRVFADPHAYWPSPAQAPTRSPYAKGNAVCAAADFVAYDEMVKGMEYLQGLFPQFVQFYKLQRDFGSGSDCTSSTSNADLCSAGLPRQGVPSQRVKSDLYAVRLTDERVADTAKKFYVFPLAIHGIERAGAEAGVRVAEDLATWAYCEAVGGATLLPNGKTNCAAEGAIPHPLLETTPGQSVTAGSALRRSSIWLVFANPDGWRRGDPDNVARFYQRYNGNGVDLNRDWPSIGYTFRPYTPWSEPETKGFGRVLKQIRDRWDGGIDLHGQLIDSAFSFTLLGASERDYAKDQRILQTVKGAWADAETRLAWSPVIKPNDADPDDPRLYGVQWGTVWDTIDYTVTGALGDWIDSPLGLGGDGIDNEMSMSHISNCGVGSCYLADFEQLHVDGNKSLVYSMVNFGLLPEDTSFAVPGKVGYVKDDTVLSNPGTLVARPGYLDLQPQQPISGTLTPANSFRYTFAVEGPVCKDARKQKGCTGSYNGGLEAKATPVNVGGISGFSTTALVLERYRGLNAEPTPQEDQAACGSGDEAWTEVNRYFNQASTYLQAGQAVHANGPMPGWWRVCLSGDLATQIAASGGRVDLAISFTREQAWEDPGQLPYSVSNMKFFDSLGKHMQAGQLVALDPDKLLGGKARLDTLRSVVISDDPFPGFSEPLPTGEAQQGQVHAPPTRAVATVPGAGDETSPPTSVADYEFDVDGASNNQQLVVTLDSPNLVANDWDLYVQRQSPTTGDWNTAGKSTTGTGDERVTLLTPTPGHYRARIVNYAGTAPPERLEIAFSNEYAGPPFEPSTRTAAELAKWGAELRRYVESGGNLVLTDGAVKNLAYMGLVDRKYVGSFTAYAGWIGFTRDGSSETYSDPLAQNVNQPGAAEGPGHRHQTYEPVPLGFAIQDEAGNDFNASPIWAVDRTEWERIGGRTVGTTGAEQVTLGELELGLGSIRIVGALLPMPTEQYYHPFGLANYALTYTGYQLLRNALN
jgi:Zinc carboxypeptidase